MTINQFLIAIGLVLFIGGCAEKSRVSAADYSNEPVGAEAKSDENKTERISSLAAIETNKNSDRKFVRTVELRFKVENVIKATYRIEDIASRHDGFVTYTSL